MSYNLEFWRYEPGITLDHQEVCEKLSDGQEVTGLETLPIAEIKARIADTFTKDGQDAAEATWESADGSFQLFTTSQFVEAVCYSMAGEEMNKIIDILLEFNCPLYDPQIGQRFDGG